MIICPMFVATPTFILTAYVLCLLMATMIIIGDYNMSKTSWKRVKNQACFDYLISNKTSNIVKSKMNNYNNEKCNKIIKGARQIMIKRLFIWFTVITLIMAALYFLDI